MDLFSLNENGKTILFIQSLREKSLREKISNILFYSKFKREKRSNILFYSKFKREKRSNINILFYSEFSSERRNFIVFYRPGVQLWCPPHCTRPDDLCHV